MHLKKIAFLLIFAGVVGLFAGMFMDTTVEASYGSNRIHNLHLQSQQQNILVVSGIFFISGIILLSAAIINPPKEYKQTEDDIKRLEQEKRNAEFSGLSRKAFIQKYFSADRIDQRFPVGLLLATLFSLWSYIYQIAPWWLVGAACMIYIFRRAEPRVLLKHMLAVYTFAYLISAWLSLDTYMDRDDVSNGQLMLIYLYNFIPGIASLIAIALLTRKTISFPESRP